MKIKVQCPCGSKFELEAEPVEGKLPYALACPTCNADVTGLANDVIKEQTPSDKPKLSIRKEGHSHAAPAPAAVPAAAPAAPVPAPESKLRIAGGHHAKPAAPPPPAPAGGAPAPAAPPAPGGVKWGDPANAPKQALKRRAKVGSLVGVIAGSAVAVAALGAWGWYAFVGSQPKVVYSVKLDAAAADDAKTPPPSYSLVAPGQVVAFTGDKISLYDVKEKKELWSGTLEPKLPPRQDKPAASATTATTPANRAAGTRGPANRRGAATPAATAALAAAAKTNAPAAGGTNKANAAAEALMAGLAAKVGELAKAGEEFGLHVPVQPVVVNKGNDIYVLFPDRIAHFSRTTGTRQDDVPLPTPVINLTYNDESILAESLTDPTHKTLTHISLSQGYIQTEELDLTPPRPVRVAAPVTSAAQSRAGANPATAGGRLQPASGPPSTLAARYARANPGRNAAAQAAAPTATAAPVDPADVPLEHVHGHLYGAGINVAELIVKLVEQKTQTTDSMKPKGKSVLDSGGLTAGKSMDAVAEMMKDMQRAKTGGKKTEDVSRYAVTLHRFFGNGASDWKGEVIGAPVLFTLKTVDVLAAGTSITVFDKQNTKRFDAKLTYPVSEFLRGHDGYAAAPALETSDTLYFADKGVLTAFDLTAGTVRWRLTSVGVSRIQADEKGMLYVNTTSAGAESIQYNDDADAKAPPEPVLLKVDPATGKTLWESRKVGEDCVLSGKFVYGVRSSLSFAWLKLEEGPTAQYNVYRLSPGSGKAVWNYHQSRTGVRSQANENWVLLQFPDEIQVLNYFSL